MWWEDGIMSGGLYNYLDSSLMNEIFGWNDIEGTVPNYSRTEKSANLHMTFCRLSMNMTGIKVAIQISKNTWILKQSLKGNGLIIVE